MIEYIIKEDNNGPDFHIKVSNYDQSKKKKKFDLLEKTLPMGNPAIFIHLFLTFMWQKICLWKTNNILGF